MVGGVVTEVLLCWTENPHLPHEDNFSGKGEEFCLVSRNGRDRGWVSVRRETPKRLKPKYKLSSGPPLEPTLGL